MVAAWGGWRNSYRGEGAEGRGTRGRTGARSVEERAGPLLCSAGGPVGHGRGSGVPGLTLVPGWCQPFCSALCPVLPGLAAPHRPLSTCGSGGLQTEHMLDVHFP